MPCLWLQMWTYADSSSFCTIANFAVRCFLSIFPSLSSDHEHVLSNFFWCFWWKLWIFSVQFLSLLSFDSNSGLSSCVSFALSLSLSILWLTMRLSNNVVFRICLTRAKFLLESFELFHAEVLMLRYMPSFIKIARAVFENFVEKICKKQQYSQIRRPSRTS